MLEPRTPAAAWSRTPRAIGSSTRTRGHLRLAPPREEAPYVDLDAGVYKLLGDFDARFPDGPPSLREADRLEVVGDVTFGRDVVVRGSVRLSGPRTIEDGAILEG